MSFFMSWKATTEETRRTMPNSYIIAFDVLQAIGLVSSYVVFLTPISSATVKRSTTWLMFMGELAIFCTTFLLLLGRQDGLAPNFGLCLTQAALVFSAPVMCAYSALGITVELYMKLTKIKDQGLRRMKLILVFGPFLIFLGIFVEILVVGLSNRKNVIRNQSGMFCTLANPISWKISSVLIIFAVTGMLFFEGIIITIFMHARRGRSAQLKRKAMQEQSKMNVLRDLTKQDAHKRRDAAQLSTIIRVTAFSALPMTTLIVIAVITSGLTHWSSRITSIVFIGVACLPISASLIFGLQGDILRAWMFWRKSTPATYAPVQYAQWSAKPWSSSQASPSSSTWSTTNPLTPTSSIGWSPPSALSSPAVESSKLLPN
ncbi:hypothetical protein C8J56DRAFT_586096 [Mycena floridula]|nr:hypothetical protein C8J56DRAFT_586096 [Mycena floridula]